MTKEVPKKVVIKPRKVEVTEGTTITIDEMFCPNCGKQFHTIYSRCQDCGQRLEKESEV